MKRIDMHTHTHASDGVLSPGELVNYAVNKGLGGLAITDHDTVDGLAEGREAAKRHKGFWFLPGIEFSTEVGKSEVHILGYGIDENISALRTLLEELKRSRYQRARKMVDKLKELGFDIDCEQVDQIAGDGVVGRLHVARALVDRGNVASIPDAFSLYLTQGKPAYVPRFKLLPEDVISFIHQWGGFSVLAHPGLLADQSIITHLISSGLMGIEANYPSHSHDATQRYLRLAHQQGLLATGGSDFHAPPSSGIRETDVGNCGVPIEAIKTFYEGKKIN